MHEDTAEEKSPRRSALGILGKVFTIFGYLLLALFVAVVIAYNYVMRPEFLEPLIKENFSKFTNGKIELKLEQTSLFRGFRIRDLVVYSPEGYSETPLLKLDQLNILYNAYGFFRGSFGVHEILLRNPQIFIEQRNNQTNIEALFKPTAEKKEEQKEEVKEDTPAKALYWFFNIHLFARITLEKLQLTFDARDKSNSIRRYANLKDFSFHFAFLTRDFNRLDPGDPAALAGLLQALVIELNPQKKIQIAYEGPEARMRSDFHLFWLLFYDGLAQTPEFVSRFLVGDEKLELALGRGRSGTMPFVAEHAIDFDPKTERLEIRNFAIRFLGDTLLSLKGGGEKLLRSDRKINISTGDSRVNLGKIYDLIATLLGKRDPYFSGYFSLKPTNVTIEGNRVDDSGGLKLEQVVFGTGALRLSVPQLDFDHAVLLDPAQKPLPVSRVMAKLRGNFNGAAIFLDALLAEDRKTNVEFSLRGLEISPFAQGQAAGAISTVLSLKGPSPEDLALALRIYSPQLIYYVDRSKSGINRIDFNVRGAVKSSADFRNSSIQLASITFTDKNKDYATAVELKSRADIQKDESIRLVYTLDGLGIFFQEALLTLPASLQEQLAGTLQTLSLGNTLRADGQTVVAMRGREQQIEHTTHLAFPDIHADDIQLLAKLKLTPAVVYLEQFSITGLRQALQVKADGTLRKATELVTDETTGKKQRVPTTIPDLRFRAELGRKAET
ncbi:MAG: hypothetical protein NZL89_04135, partial [Leptospiraceae bacterium]|nr:hypothetical protein [Leptospiraceae bacterium]